ncbi:MAG: hypothetical protein C0417_13730 [Chlorobiaceae bacterium]|nr:hypothetical protein [Chlorobiaceae bacterium]
MSQILAGLLPVFIFLVALYYLDSYKLIKLQWVVLTIALGCMVALAALFVNTMIISFWDLSPKFHSGYIAPIIEELLKASFIIFLIKSKKVGFMVDAALYSFALGAGFAFTENLYYLYNLQENNILLWLVRGFGTAMMHCGTTALFGIISRNLSDLYQQKDVKIFLPGLLIAIVFHSLYNHFILSPVVSTILLVIVLPFLMLIVFKRSEDSTRKWLGTGLDSDLELLELIMTGNISDSKIGSYLHSLKSRFSLQIVGDMLCLIRLHTELGMRAKGMLIMREAGFETPLDSEVEEKLAELKYLETSIGKTGKFAIAPILHWGSRSSWQLNLLKK